MNMGRVGHGAVLNTAPRQKALKPETDPAEATSRNQILWFTDKAKWLIETFKSATGPIDLLSNSVTALENRVKGFRRDFTKLNKEDLDAEDLNGAVLIGSDWRGVDWPGAQLNDTHWYPSRVENPLSLMTTKIAGANFAGGSFRNADLRGVISSDPAYPGMRVNLRGADLSGADLRGWALKDFDLTGANLKGADLRKVDFYNNKLVGVKNLEEAIIGDGPVPKEILFKFIRQEKLTREDLIKLINAGVTDLNDICLEESQDLRGIGLSENNVSLKRARLPGAILEGEDLRFVSLQGAKLMGAKLKNANCAYANLSDLDFSDTDLEGANLFHANLDNSIFGGSQLAGADLGFTSAKHTSFVDSIFKDAKAHHMSLEDTEFSKKNEENLRLIKYYSNQELNRPDIEELLALGYRNFDNRIIAKGANLKGLGLSQLKVSFIGSTLQGVDLSSENLERVNLKGALLEEANLDGVSFGNGSNADRAYAKYISHQSLSFDDLQNLLSAGINNLPNARIIAEANQKLDLRELKIPAEGINLSHASFENVNLSAMNLSKINLSHARIVNSNLSKLQLNNSQLDGLWIINSDTEGLAIFDSSKVAMHISNPARSKEYYKNDLGDEIETLTRADLAQEIAQGRTDFHGVRIRPGEALGNLFQVESLPIARMLIGHKKFDFSGAKIIGVDFSGAKILEGADFSNADLRGSIFCSANLQNAKFNGAFMHDVNLERAELLHADFKDAKLSNANLKGAKLLKANFDSAFMENVQWNGTELDQAIFNSTKFTLDKSINLSIDKYFQRSSLTREDFENLFKAEAILGLEFRDFKAITVNAGEDLRGLDFASKKVDFRNANLGMLDLRGLDLKGVRTEGANFRASQLEGASFTFNETQNRSLIKYFSGQDLNSEDLQILINGSWTNLQNAIIKAGEDLRGVLSGHELDLSGASLIAVDMRGEDLRKVIFADANLKDAKLDETNLEKADFRRARLKNTSMNNAKTKGILLDKAYIFDNLIDLEAIAKVKRINQEISPQLIIDLIDNLIRPEINNTLNKLSFNKGFLNDQERAKRRSAVNKISHLMWTFRKSIDEIDDPQIVYKNFQDLMLEIEPLIKDIEKESLAAGLMSAKDSSQSTYPVISEPEVKDLKSETKSFLDKITKPMVSTFGLALLGLGLMFQVSSKDDAGIDALMKRPVVNKQTEVPGAPKSIKEKIREAREAGLTIDLSGQDLRGVDLSNEDLSDANLQNTNLEGADFSGANLTSVNLTGANISAANFKNTNLIFARIIDANVTGADFEGANISNAEISNLLINKKQFERQDLLQVSVRLKAINTEINANGASFPGINLKGALLKNAKLQNVDLTGADLTGANLEGADLSRAKLNEAILIDANFNDTTLKGAEIQKAILYNTSFIRADLSAFQDRSKKIKVPTKFMNSYLKNVNFYYANLVDADFSCTDPTISFSGKLTDDKAPTHPSIKGCDFDKACIHEAKFLFTKFFNQDKHSLEYTDFSKSVQAMKAYFTDARITNKIKKSYYKSYRENRKKLLRDAMQTRIKLINEKPKNRELARLSSIDLDYGDLSNLDLSKLEFAFCKFRSANLQKTKLIDTRFKHCNFNRADFTNTDLSGQKLGDSLFEGARFDNANLTNTVFERRNKKGKIRPTNFRGASFLGANLKGARMRGARFSGSKFKDIKNLDKAKLAGANFIAAEYNQEEILKKSGVKMDSYANEPSRWSNRFLTTEEVKDMLSDDLVYVDLSSYDLRGLRLFLDSDSKSKTVVKPLVRANLSNSDLRGAALRADLSKANLQGANLRYALLYKSPFLYANLVDTDLRASRFIQSNLLGAKIDNARLDGAKGISKAHLESLQKEAKPKFMSEKDIELAIRQKQEEYKKINKNRKEYEKKESVDLKGIPLDYLDLRTQNLRGFDFSGQKIRNAYFAKSIKKIKANNAIKRMTIVETPDLTGAKFTGADLSGSHMTDLTLHDVDISHATLNNVNLVGAKINGANFAKSKLNNVNLKAYRGEKDILFGALRERVNFEDAQILNTNFDYRHFIETSFNKVRAQNASFRDTILENITLDNAHMRNVDFSNAGLLNLDGFNSNLAWADFRFAKLYGANLQRMSLENSNLDFLEGKNARFFASVIDHSKMRNVDVKDSELISVIFNYSDMSNSKFSGCNFSSSIFEGVNLTDSSILGAKFTESVLFDSTLKNTNVSAANFSNASLLNLNVSDSDFSGSNFSKALFESKDGEQKERFMNSNFSSADFSEAQIRDIEMINNKFDKANFSGANIQGSTFVGGSFKNANLKHASLIGVKFLKGKSFTTETKKLNWFRSIQVPKLREGNLISDFSGADLAGITFNDCDLKGTYLKKAKLNGAKFLNSDLHGLDLRNANLLSSSFRGSDLSGVDLSGADLRFADLRGADLTNTNFEGADLTGADLTGAKILNTKFKDAKSMVECNLTDVNTKHPEGVKLKSSNKPVAADFRFVDLSRAKLNNAYLKGSMFQNASLVKAKLEKANLENSDFKRASLDDADLTLANLTSTDFYDASLDRIKVDRTIFTNAKIDGRSLPKEIKEGNIKEARFDLEPNELRHPDESNYAKEIKVFKDAHKEMKPETPSKIPLLAIFSGLLTVLGSFIGLPKKKTIVNKNLLNLDPIDENRIKKIIASNITDLEGLTIEPGTRMQDIPIGKNRVSLANATLAEVDLSNITDLNKVNFMNANLEAANLSNSNLEGAILYGTDLERANLSRADLEGADLRFANLRAADLRGTNIDGANFFGAKLKDLIIFGDPNIDRIYTKILSKALVSEAELITLLRFGITNLRGAILRNINFVNVFRQLKLDNKFNKPLDLSGADLSGSDLHGLNLAGFNLKDANLSMAKLEGTSLEQANTLGANFQGTIAGQLSNLIFSRT